MKQPTRCRPCWQIITGLMLLLSHTNGALAVEPNPTVLTNSTAEELARTLSELTSQNYVSIQSVERHDITLDLSGISPDQIDLQKFVSEKTPYQLRFTSGIWFILDDNDPRSLDPFRAGPKSKRPVSLDVTETALTALLQILGKAWDKPMRPQALDHLRVTARMIDVPADVALAVIAEKYSLLVRETQREIVITAKARPPAAISTQTGIKE